MNKIVLTLKDGAKVSQPEWKMFEVHPEGIYIKADNGAIISVWNADEWSCIDVVDL